MARTSIVWSPLVYLYLFTFVINLTCLTFSMLFRILCVCPTTFSFYFPISFPFLQVGLTYFLLFFYHFY
jgi:hypothetical protein